VVALPAADPVPTRRVSALHRRSMARSPAIRALLQMLREQAD
jgi:DNA-binding transcriptional LysR family regulator